MTKEQAIKHKEIIKWWLDNTDKGVFYKGDLLDKWLLSYVPSFYTNAIYVQNDEYAEYRKALADGKTIQVYSDFLISEWIVFIVEHPTGHFPSGYKYRIKPKKHKFKVGDWIVNKNSKEIKLFTEELKEMFDDIAYNSWTEWEPKNGEWCVFWDDDVEEFLIGRYGSIHEQDSHGLGELQFYYTKDYWDNVAPLEFIEILKDK